MGTPSEWSLSRVRDTRSTPDRSRVRVAWRDGGPHCAVFSLWQDRLTDENERNGTPIGSQISRSVSLAEWRLNSRFSFSFFMRRPGERAQLVLCLAHINLWKCPPPARMNLRLTKHGSFQRIKAKKVTVTPYSRHSKSCTSPLLVQWLFFLNAAWLLVDWDRETGGQASKCDESF